MRERKDADAAGSELPARVETPLVRPGLTAPASVLALQRAAGNRATQRALARRELPDSMAGDGAAQQSWNWTTSDRVNNTDKWKEACRYNLENLRNEEYKRIPERRDFYKWFYEATAARGYHTRWALAAYIVAGGMAEMAEVDWTEGLAPVSNELQGVTRIGNQVIFDDVLPKLRRIWQGPVLTGADARREDQRILAEEQHLIQNLYNSVSQDTRDRFSGMANMTYWRAQFGRAIRLGGHVAASPHNKGGQVPEFDVLVPGGDINTPAGRWLYGMRLAAQMSDLPDYGPLDPMPAVGADYSGSAQYDRLNVRPHLHMLDAMLNDAWFDESGMITQLQNLNPREQRELATDTWRMHRLVRGLSFGELKRGIENLADMPLADKLTWLRFAALNPNWEGVSYSEIQGMVQLAARRHPEFLTAMQTDFWRNQFLDICDDDDIDDAVADLRLPAAMAADWIRRERQWVSRQ